MGLIVQVGPRVFRGLNLGMFLRVLLLDLTRGQRITRQLNRLLRQRRRMHLRNSLGLLILEILMPPC